MIKLVLQALFDLTGKLLNSMFWKNDNRGLEDPLRGQFCSLPGDENMLGRIVTTVCCMSVVSVVPIIKKNFLLYAQRKETTK